MWDGVTMMSLGERCRVGVQEEVGRLENIGWTSVRVTFLVDSAECLTGSK